MQYQIKVCTLKHNERQKYVLLPILAFLIDYLINAARSNEFYIGLKWVGTYRNLASALHHAQVLKFLSLSYWPIHTLHIFFYRTKPDKQKLKNILTFKFIFSCLGQGKFLTNPLLTCGQQFTAHKLCCHSHVLECRKEAK